MTTMSPSAIDSTREALAAWSARQDHVVFTASAVETMIVEGRHHPGRETGGVLPGLLSPLLVLAAGAGGDRAVRQASRFTQDAGRDHEVVEECRKRFGPCVSVAGDWHTHPGNMKAYSPTDNRTAQKNARLYADGKAYLCVIITQHSLASRQPELNVYGINRPDENLRRFTYEVVADDAPEVQAAVRQAPVILDSNPQGFWGTSAFSFIQNPVGRERIRDEVRHLESLGAKVTSFRAQNELGLRLAIRCRNRRFELLLPPEYPLSAPRVWVGRSRREIALDLQQRWSSAVSLTEFVVEALAICNCQRCLTQRLVTPELRAAR